MSDRYREDRHFVFLQDQYLFASFLKEFPYE
jgi:hypothetical protein